jgi:hypothetical protein
MEIEKKLTENLKLTGIQENNSQDGELITVQCFFEFFGKEGEAYVVLEHLSSEFARYAMTEICSELSDSFNDLLDDDDNWKKIIEAIKEYIVFWEKCQTMYD